MSIEEIILNNWLNNNYKFEPKITDIQNDFKNGYKFGELLFKFELISKEDFNLYQNSNIKQEIEDNFYLLQKNLKDILNFKLSQEEIDDIINNRNRYNIVLLLYRIKNSYYKYKIHFSDIMVFINPMKQNDLNEKAKILLEPSNNNEIKKNDENEDIFPEEDETIKNPKKIKIQKLSLIKKNSSLNKEKTYMNKIILPKIQKDSKNYRNQNFENNTINIQENYKFDKIPLLNKNKSEINIFKPTPLSLDENRKKPLKFIVKNKKRFDLTKELLKGKNQ